MNRILNGHDRLTEAAFAVACAALMMMLSAYLYEVVARYGFSAPTRWSSDVVQYALCASVSLALPAVTRDSAHVAITFLVDRLAPGPQARATRITQWLGACVMAVTASAFALVAAAQARDGLETVAAYAIPKWWLSAMVVFGCASAAMHLLRQAVGTHAARSGNEPKDQA